MFFFQEAEIFKIMNFALLFIGAVAAGIAFGSFWVFLAVFILGGLIIPE